MKIEKRLIPGIARTLVAMTLMIQASFGQKANSYLLPPEIKDPSSTTAYSSINRTGTGVPSMAVSLNGRLWAVWYSGITPGKIIELCPNAYVVVSTSSDNGKTWKEVLAIDPDGAGPVQAFDPQAWIDPDGKLWIFWSHTGEKSGVWAVSANDGDKEKPLWSAPKRLTDGIMMCKPIVLSTGEWILPASIRDIKNSARVVVSVDKGINWKERGAADVPKDFQACDEHMIVERKDGSLWMLVRTSYGIGESFSPDRGITWSSLTPSQIKHTTSRFFISRLKSGNLLLVKNGPMDMRTEGPRQRCYLMAFISKDDGKTWSKGLLLDGRAPVSYPDGQQTADGTIYIIWDYNRSKDQMIHMTSFTEDDIFAESDINMVKVFESRKVVSKGGPK